MLSVLKTIARGWNKVVEEVMNIWREGTIESSNGPRVMDLDSEERCERMAR